MHDTGRRTLQHRSSVFALRMLTYGGSDELGSQLLYIYRASTGHDAAAGQETGFTTTEHQASRVTTDGCRDNRYSYSHICRYSWFYRVVSHIAWHHTWAWPLAETGHISLHYKALFVVWYTLDTLQSSVSVSEHWTVVLIQCLDFCWYSELNLDILIQ